MTNKHLAKKMIGGIYSWAADKIYEPLVVNGAFKMLGRDLHDRIAEQGRAAVDVAAGRPILDLPVGTGTFTIPIARDSPGVVVGADIAAGMVKQTHRAARGAGSTNLHGVQADAHHLPFKDETFGAIMCTNGLQVMPGLERTLTELRRVLASDGHIFVSIVSMPVSSAPGTPALFMSRRQLTRALRAAGLRVVESRRERLATLLEAVPV